MVSISFEEAIATKYFDHANDYHDRWQEWPPSQETIEAFLIYHRHILQLYEQAGTWPWTTWRNIPQVQSDSDQELSWSVSERRLSFSSPQ